MRAKYISRTKPAQAFSLEASQAAAGGSGSADPQPQTEPGFPFTAYACSSGGEKPKLYKGEGLGWSSDTLEPGTVISVIGNGNDIYWYKVQVNGQKGYMPGKFLSR